MEDSKLDIFKLFLSNFDFFGFKMEYLYRGKTRYKSCYGGLITILCFILIAFIFAEISKECFNKTNPFVREAIFYEHKSNLHEKDFFFGLYFRDKDHNVIENFEKYLTVEGIIHNNTLKISEEEEISLPFKRCESKDFSKFDISGLKISDYLCLDIKDKFNLINLYNEFPKISLSINVKECKDNENDIGKLLIFLFF